MTASLNSCKKLENVIAVITEDTMETASLFPTPVFHLTRVNVVSFLGTFPTERSTTPDMHKSRTFCIKGYLSSYDCLSRRLHFRDGRRKLPNTGFDFHLYLITLRCLLPRVYRNNNNTWTLYKHRKWFGSQQEHYHNV